MIFKRNIIGYKQMKYLDEYDGIVDADSSDDAAVSVEKLEILLAEAQKKLDGLAPDYVPLERAEILVRMGGTLVDLQRGEEAFARAKEAFDIFTKTQYWDGAVQACDVMYQADQPDSMAALGQGVWIAVTFPVDPELTVNMLNHIVEETPNDSDGAAIAAVTAHYVVDLRTKDKQKENLEFFTHNLIASVARRHSQVENQDQFDYWFNKLELNDPQLFLPRLRNVVDVMVQDDWWIDREAIWASMPH